MFHADAAGHPSKEQKHAGKQSEREHSSHESINKATIRNTTIRQHKCLDTQLWCGPAGGALPGSFISGVVSWGTHRAHPGLNAILRTLLWCFCSSHRPSFVVIFFFLWRRLTTTGFKRSNVRFRRPFLNLKPLFFSPLLLKQSSHVLTWKLEPLGHCSWISPGCFGHRGASWWTLLVLRGRAGVPGWLLALRWLSRNSGATGGLRWPKYAPEVGYKRGTENYRWVAGPSHPRGTRQSAESPN